MDPSKPNEPSIEQGRSIPRSRPSDDEVLEGEIVGKDEPLGRPTLPPQPPAAAAKKGLGLRKTLLLVVAGVAAALCLGGSLTAYVLYDKATKPERGSPLASLQQYVTAKFDRRDEVSAGLYVCRSPDLGRMEDLLAQVKNRESETKFGFQVALSDATEIQDGASARIKASLNIMTTEPGGATSHVIQRWEFLLVESDGWRVCGAERLP